MKTNSAAVDTLPSKPRYADLRRTDCGGSPTSAWAAVAGQVGSSLTNDYTKFVPGDTSGEKVPLGW